MLSPEEESRINQLAYVPEHTVSLMRIISGGEPFFKDGFLYFKGPYWIIIVGYPLSGEFSEGRIVKMVSYIGEKYDFDYIWLIAPHIPDNLKKDATAYSKDYYYTLDLNSFSPPQRLLRQVEKARREVTVRISKAYTKEHSELSKKFMEEKDTDPFVKGLYESMETYLFLSQSALLIDAYDLEERLVGFYVIETVAENFITYLVGCRKTDNGPRWASDLIFAKMVEIAIDMRKKYIHLGLGVNEGVTRFKKKWGGMPTIPYEFAELRKKTGFLNIINRITDIL